MKEFENMNGVPIYFCSFSLAQNPNYKGSHARVESHHLELMIYCKKASKPSTMQTQTQAKWVELGDKAFDSTKISKPLNEIRVMEIQSH